MQKTLVTTAEKVAIADPVVSAKRLGQMLCDAIGVPFERVASIKLTVTAGEPATIEIKRRVRVGDADGIAEVLSHFVVVEPEQLISEESDE